LNHPATADQIKDGKAAQELAIRSRSRLIPGLPTVDVESMANELIAACFVSAEIGGETFDKMSAADLDSLFENPAWTGPDRGRMFDAAYTCDDSSSHVDMGSVGKG